MTSGSGDAGRRQVAIKSWGASDRVATVTAGAATVLSVPENFNPGWVAEVDGQRLQALRVDGWQQAWVLPEGDAVTVDLSYRPQRVYRVLLPMGLGISGALLLAGLVLLVLGAVRRRRQAHGRPPADEPPWPEVPPAPKGSVTAALTAVCLLLLGPAAALGMLLGLWPRVHRRLEVAAGTVVASAVIDVLGGPSWSYPVADALAALGVGLVIGFVLVDGRVLRLRGRRVALAPAREPGGAR
ncbi:hypothetical protein BH11ACT8_BH11ACT8_26530 [soil metagenome]